MKKINLIFPVVFLFCFSAQAQDIHFSQSSETPLLLNPAEAGLGHDLLAVINFKDQWKSVGAPYRTFNVSTDFSVLKKKSGSHMGIGVNVFSDRAGDAGMGTTTGALHISGVIAANDKNLFSAGISGGFGQRSLQMQKLYWDNQYDGSQFNPALSSGEPANFSNHGYLDISAGGAWFYGDGHSTLSSNDARTINLGFAVHHLNKPLYSFYDDQSQHLPIKYIFHGQADIGIKNYSLILEPSYLIMIQGGHREITPGMIFKYVPHEASKYTGRVKASAFLLGGYFRMKDAVVIATGYEFSNWSVRMSYDVNISNLKTASQARGGFEMAISFVAPNPFGGGSTSRLFD